MSWRWQKRAQVPLLRAGRLERYRWLVHGFTTRRPGEFNLNYSVAPEASGVTRNRQRLLGALGNSRWQLATLHQEHSDLIRVLAGPSGAPAGARREPDGAMKLTGDALVTGQHGLLLAVQVADCLPILLVEPKQRVVAAVHAGWRGTVKRIAEKTVGRMRAELGCNPGKMLAVIGPAIHGCCYEVGREVVEAFASQFDYWEKLVRPVKPSPPDVHWQQKLFSPSPPQPGEARARPALTSPPTDKFNLDLIEANRRQLRAAGLLAANLLVSPLCTACRTDLLFSHRAENGRLSRLPRAQPRGAKSRGTGRMMGVIGIAAR